MINIESLTLLNNIGGGQQSSTHNLFKHKTMRKEELLSSDRERNFNFRLYKSNQEGGGRYLILPSLIRDKNIGGGGEQLSSSSSRNQIQKQYFSCKGGEGNLVAFSLIMGGVV